MRKTPLSLTSFILCKYVHFTMSLLVATVYHPLSLPFGDRLLCFLSNELFCTPLNNVSSNYRRVEVEGFVSTDPVDKTKRYQYVSELLEYSSYSSKVTSVCNSLATVRRFAYYKWYRRVISVRPSNCTGHFCFTYSHIPSSRSFFGGLLN